MRRADASSRTIAADAWRAKASRSPPLARITRSRSTTCPDPFRRDRSAALAGYGGRRPWICSGFSPRQWVVRVGGRSLPGPALLGPALLGAANPGHEVRYVRRLPARRRPDRQVPARMMPGASTNRITAPIAALDRHHGAALMVAASRPADAGDRGGMARLPRRSRRRSRSRTGHSRWRARARAGSARRPTSSRRSPFLSAGGCSARYRRASRSSAALRASAAS